MSVQKARGSLKVARLELADALESLPRPSLFKGRRKRNKIIQALNLVDNSLEKLRGL